MASDTQHGQVRALVGEMYEAARKHRFNEMTTTEYMAVAERALAAADALDAARPQPVPITQEALRESGWKYLLWNGKVHEWSVKIGYSDSVTVRYESASTPHIPFVYVTISMGRKLLRHIHTMQQLSQLVTLLTGQPTPGEREHGQATE